MTSVGGAAPATTPALRIIALGVLLPAIAGAACVLGFAPFYAWPVPIISLVALFYVWEGSVSPRGAALSGFAFGLGYFVAGVSWVFVSLHYYGAMPAVLAAVATFLFCAFLALFPALAGWITVRLAGDPSLSRVILAPAAFVACEWLRGWIFTGFPWLTLGVSQVPSGPLRGFAPIVGAYGVSLLVAGVAALFVAIIRGNRRKMAPRVALAALALLPFIGGLILPGLRWTEPAGEPFSIALLQGNVPQELKWRDEVRARTLADYRQRVFDANAKIVVLPETALPAFFDQLPPDYLESLREHARRTGKEILLGTVEREFRGQEYDYYNSVVNLTATGRQAYRKRHLVPFGEFIPVGFRWVLAILKIPLSDFASGAARQPPLEAGATSFGVAICYEDLFGEEVIDALPAAQVLLNVSNVAWFGRSFAPEQHLQASQARALETGRWMVRSTNTGATAAIDEQGRVVSRLPGFTSGTLVAQVVPRSGATPYVRWGNIPVILAILAIFVAVWLRGRSASAVR